MAQETFGAVVKRRVQGLLFLVIIVALVGLSIAIYNKAFTSVVTVKMLADHTGNALMLDSDVKERGIIVGSVTGITSKGDGAELTLELDPGRVKEIPSNVSAQILPKTLFGEQYVALIIPPKPAQHIAGGDVIPQDRSKGALETEKVLGDLYPLLTAVQPAQLNATLTALAEALHNRGNKLGQTLVTFDRYLRAMNPHTQQLVTDLEQLGKVSLEYNSLAPDIFATLTNLQTSVRTVVQKQAGFNSLLVNGSDTSVVLKDFLADNQQRLIEMTGQMNKVYPLLQRYTPEYSCLFTGINNLFPLVGKAIYNHRIHLSITDNQKNLGPYTSTQTPKYISGYGANCFGLPDHITPTVDGNFQIPAKYKCLNDGAPLTGDCGGATATTSSVDNHALNSAAENALVDTLVSSQLHTAPDKVSGAATLLAGPLMRGQQVVVK